jgi:ribose 5-phosphate isomerase RpiB
MNIFFGADHRGLELKNKIVGVSTGKNIRIQDFGSYQYDPQDDYLILPKKSLKPSNRRLMRH